MLVDFIQCVIDAARVCLPECEVGNVFVLLVLDRRELPTIGRPGRVLVAERDHAMFGSLVVGDVAVGNVEPKFFGLIFIEADNSGGNVDWPVDKFVTIFRNRPVSELVVRGG